MMWWMWRVRGVCMARVWLVRGACMAHAWRVHGVCMACARRVHRVIACMHRLRVRVRVHSLACAEQACCGRQVGSRWASGVVSRVFASPKWLTVTLVRVRVRASY